MPQSALENLYSFVNKADTVNVLMVADKEHAGSGAPPFEVQRLDMSKGLAEKFRDTVSNGIAARAENRLAIPYTTGRKLDRHEIFYVKLEDNSDMSSTLDYVESTPSAKVFEKKEDFGQRMAFYCIVFEGKNGKRAAFYRKHSSKNELSSNLVALIVEKNHFDRLKQRAYLFDNKTDFFTWGGYLFVKGAYNFRLIFKRFEKLQDEAKNNVDKIKQVVPIENGDEFLKACQSQPQMASKAARVASQPYLDDVTMDDIEKTIDEFDLDINIIKKNGEKKLAFEKDVSRRWIILKLLDDDFLGSIMTDLKYDTNSKSLRE